MPILFEAYLSGANYLLVECNGENKILNAFKAPQHPLHPSLQYNACAQVLVIFTLYVRSYGPFDKFLFFFLTYRKVVQCDSDETFKQLKPF